MIDISVILYGILTIEDNFRPDFLLLISILPKNQSDGDK